MRINNHNLLRTLAAGAALLALTAAPAFAGGPLANCQPGQPYLWPNGGVDIPFNPDQGDLGPLTNAQGVSLVADAFQVWEDVPSASATHLNAGLLPVDVDFNNFFPYLAPAAPDGLSAIVFDETGQIFDFLFGANSGVLGFAGPEWLDPVDCEIDEGVSFLNGPTFTNLAVALDVMVHEFGHYQNMAHTVVNGQIVLGDSNGPTPFNTFPPVSLVNRIETMYPFYFGTLAGFSTLDPDDVGFFSTLYPEPGFFASTGTISGSVLGPQGQVQVTGVNVIARNLAAPFDDALSAISSDATDDFTQGGVAVGQWTINGLTPGAGYVLFIDGIFAGGFSTPLLNPLPGPEEFYNGSLESGDAAADNPLSAVLLTPVAGVPTTGVDFLINARQPGPIALGDDTNTVVFLPFTFKLCGQDWSFVNVNSNGHLTFGIGDNDAGQTVAEFLSGPPRIAGLWTDLDPSAGGQVSYSLTSSELTVTWDAVPKFGEVSPNSFSITLKHNGNWAQVEYGDLAATDGIAGVTCGGDFTTGSETETDLVSHPGVNVNKLSGAAVFESFDSGDNDLANARVKYTNIKK